MTTVYANQSACKTPFRSVSDELLFYSSPKRMSSYIRLEIMLWILCMLQSMFHMTCGCVAEERIALMHVRSSLVKANSEAPESWGQSDDCCSWERVTCDDKVARVSGLDLTNTFAALGNSSAESECWNLNLAVFSPLHELQVLDLSGNYACLHNLDGLQGLTKLRYLNLSDNNVIGNDTMGSLGKLASLEVINLFRSNISGTIPNTAFKKFKNMRELHLRSNQLSGSIPSSLFELPRLEYLDLSENLFQGHIPMSSFAKFSSSLRALKLPGNNLNGAFHFFWLRNCTMLKKIDLSGNSDLSIDVKFHGLVPPFQLTSLKLSGCNIDDSLIVGPNFLGTQRHLRVLDLSHNNLTGTIPSWNFTGMATLVYLNIANNSLVGSIDPMWQHQSALQIINISSNHLVGQLPTNSGSLFPNLTVLDASNNIISGYLPPSLCNISSMTIIDLSKNKFTGEVPTCLFTDFYGLNILKLSNNNLGGTIFGGVSKLSVMSIYLDNNKFEGSVPSNLSGNLLIMDLHDNKLSGKLDASLLGLSSLQVLSVASNNLTGGISPAICKLSDIRILDMSDNSFAGLPNCADKLPLYLLNMSGNSLSSFSSDFLDSSHITVLDLRYNQLIGSLHWIHRLSQIKLLLLGGNRFQGQISPSICHLQYLNIIDLSDNKISGSLPPCIGGISFGYHAYDLDLNTLFDLVYFSTGFSEIDDDDPSPMYDTSYGLQGFTFSTKGNLYTYSRNFFNLMFGIDLSGNMLSGEIPWEIGNLSYVRSLNLSNNFFSGQIPSTLANMSSMESLDLSHNELNGPIPSQLSQLWSLEVFSVAYNNLSGCIPVSGQLSSFSMDSYVGNKNLQNKSQGNACSADSGRAASPTPTEGVDDTPDDPILIIYVVTASFVLAFWTTIAFSFCHPYGRSVMLKL